MFDLLRDAEPTANEIENHERRMLEERLLATSSHQLRIKQIVKVEQQRQVLHILLRDPISHTHADLRQSFQQRIEPIPKESRTGLTQQFDDYLKSLKYE